MMAPYAIAHMKLGLKLAETGYHFATEERARIYLTNALEPWQQQLPLIGFDALAHEAAAVNEIKRHKRFTVVIGNPPYSGHSTNIGQWITSMVNDYYFVDGQPLDEKNTKWLLDDYVKFVRLGEKAVFTSGWGVLGYITNHGFIDNPTFRGMRAHLLKSFTQLSALDLHGNTKKVAKTTTAKTDENVFDIQQGVAITLGVKSSGSSSARHADLVGSRLEKYGKLADTTASTTTWETVQPVAPFYVLQLQDADLRDEYEVAVKVTEIFPLNGWGIATRKDYLLVDFDRDALAAKFKDIVSAPAKKSIEKYEIQESPHWDFAAAIPKLPKNVEKSVRPLLFRPFDTRYVYYERAMIERGDHRYPLMRHMLQPNICLITIRRLEVGGGFEHTFCADQLSVLHSISMKEGNFVFPLFAYPDEAEPQGTLLCESERRPNFGSGFLKSLAAKLGLKTGGKWNLPVDLTPEDIFHYAYAVFHSPGYRSRYAEFLKIDFPRLPLTGNLELFRALARLGGELTALHLLESPKLAQPITEFIGKSKEVTKIGWTDDTVWLDAGGKKAATTSGNSGFKGVPEAVWNFHIGGYQVCEKWLKDRRGRTLTDEDIAHYHKIVIALSETIRLMAGIDEVIDTHGGWPGAFAGK
jgi:predicted helicase